MTFELSYSGRKNVEKWFGILTSQGPERSLIHKSLVPRMPKDAALELWSIGRWKVERDGDYYTYWQESA